MKTTMYCSISRHKIQLFAVLCAVLFAVSFAIGWRAVADADNDTLTCWVLCKPGDYIHIREWPGRNAVVLGRLECGDSFETTGRTKNGWVEVACSLEDTRGWIYSGYLVFEEPVQLGEYGKTCTISANGRVACRRWMGGPKVANRPWIANGSTVTVFCIADGWACTSRGYVKAEYLEADPE